MAHLLLVIVTAVVHQVCTPFNISFLCVESLVFCEFQLLTHIEKQ